MLRTNLNTTLGPTLIATMSTMGTMERPQKESTTEAKREW
jgi:hypothetical protein